jgi:hypothetical protein
MKNSILVFVFCLFLSCNKKNDTNVENSNSSYSNSAENENTDYEENTNSDYSSSEENEEEESDTFSNSTSDCGLDDGSYSATVDYNNPATGYSATYTLDVDVEDCQVVQINFPNDGYLDEDHISAADLDDDGNASVYGEEGKTYEIKIDN